MAKEWIESVQRLKNKPKKTAVKDLKKTIDAIINGDTLPISEGEKAATEGLGPPATTVTTSTNPTNPRVLKKKQERTSSRRNVIRRVPRRPYVCSHSGRSNKKITKVE